MKLLLPLLSIFMICILSCTQKTEVKTYNEGINVIPKPSFLTEKEGRFELNKKTSILYNSPELESVANYFAEKIAAATGYSIPTAEKMAQDKNSVFLSLEPAEKLNNEGYLLESTPEGVTIRANTANGLFYGMQTFLQLLPAEIESTSKISGIAWSIPCVSIKDEPRFVWRGMHLDISRHFIPADSIKKQIDVLAMYKINILHLHLTDDQGWRIESKKYPKLTEIGANRTEFDGSTNGGFLTQNEIKDLVAYAAERYITIVPEIELPGHAMAALTAYPELGCTGGPYAVRTVWGVEEEVFCAGKEETFAFLENILDEIIPLFPGTYVHIGGDECPKLRWNECPLCKKRMQTEHLKDAHELQSYFVQRIEKTVSKHGKKMIGWDEILEGGLAPSATVMSWRGEEGGIAAANMGHDVVMTPGQWMYIDKYQGDSKIESVTIGGLNTLENVYGYEPLPEILNVEKQKHILGAQCNTWAEYMYTPELREYMIYPRILALAELTWTPKDQKDYTDFERRINNHLVRLDKHAINYHIPLPEQPNGSCNTVAFVDSVSVAFQTSRPEIMVYTLDGTEPKATSTVYKDTLKFTESGVINIRTLLPSGVMSKNRTIAVEKQTYTPASNVNTKIAGLKGKISKGRFVAVKDTEKVSAWEDFPVKSLQDVPITPGYGPIKEDIFFAVILEGYLDIPEDGVYYFSTETDQLWLDKQLLISNEGEVKRFSRNDKSIALAKGLHPVKVVYLSNIHGGWPNAWEGLRIQYRKSDQQEFSPVNAAMLFQ